MNSDRQQQEQVIRKKRRMILLARRNQSTTQSIVSIPVRVVTPVTEQPSYRTSRYHPSVAMLKNMTQNTIEHKNQDLVGNINDDNTKNNTENKVAHFEFEEIKQEIGRLTIQTNMLTQRSTENLNNVKKSSDDTNRQIQKHNSVLETMTEDFSKMNKQLHELRNELGSINQQFYKISQTLLNEKPVTHIFFYAIANKKLTLYDDNKEECEEFCVETNEKVILNYPMIKENNRIWIQIRRLSENGAVRMFWVKLFSDNNMNFENFSFF